MTTFSGTNFWLDEYKFVSAPNTDGMVNCLRQPGQLHHDTKTPVREFWVVYNNSGTLTNPATETKSIGLPADARVAKFLQPNLESLILTSQLFPIYQDLQKPCNATRTATHHTTGPLTIIRRNSDHSAARTTSNLGYRDKTTFRRLSICTPTLKMPAESSCPRTYKKLALAPLLFIN